MTDPDPWLDHNDQYVPVEMRRRTLPEQVEYLVQQVALLVAKTNQLEHDAEAFVLAVKSLENRMYHLELPPAPKRRKPIF